MKWYHPQASVLGWWSWDRIHPFSKHSKCPLFQSRVLFWSHLTTWPAPMPSLDHPDGQWQISDVGTCAGLSRGDLQGFSPWQCSALLVVTFETVVPARFRSFLAFLITIDSLRGESLHDSPDWGFLKTSGQSVRPEFLLVARWSNTYFVQ